MALDPEQLAQLQAAADSLADQVPVAQRAAFKADYMEVMSALNEKIDARLNYFEDEIGPLVQALMPQRPAGVLAVLQAHRNTVHEAANKLLTDLTNIPHPAIRGELVSCIVDTATYCLDALTESNKKAVAREKAKEHLS